MRKLFLIFFVIALIGFAIYKDNRSVGTSYYDLKVENLPKEFDSYRIVQLSDLHDAKFGENHEVVVSKVKMANPDVIFITGDFIDSNRYNLEQSLLLVKEFQDVAPIYYVTGNHEIATNEADHIKNELIKLGVRVLSDEVDIVTLPEGGAIAIGGIEDPLDSTYNDEEAIEKSLRRTFETVPNDMYKILLSHRPEFIDLYNNHSINLTFSGHAHGGQFRIPGIGVLISPGQGLFPKLTSGVHEKDGSFLVISRGLGNSILPIRLFNQPEIVVVTLYND